MVSYCSAETCGLWLIIYSEISPAPFDRSHVARILHALPDGCCSSSAPDLPMHGIRIDSQGATEPWDVYCSLIGSKSRSEL